MKHFILIVFMVIILTSSLAYSDTRQGEAAGIFFTPVTVKNYLAGKNNESTVNRWSIPIHYGQYGDGLHYDLATDFAGWGVLLLLGDGIDTPNTPAFKDNKNFAFIDVNLASFRMAIDIFELGVPILLGGQGSLGYMGIAADAKAGFTYFEKGSYASYGVNAGTSLELGDQFMQTLFLYDWLYMGDEKNGTRWGVEVEYFPFPASSAMDFVRFKAFTKSTTMSYPKMDANSDFKYSDFQIGLGVIFNILF